ncbi:hypothetical protein P280DRAFT_3059 [Massarina eburnea CBS 473.64]|uniref:Uncharacterized protein n=1 Tax=Massarina eburnea CBS 473.64 TaxID=1395130 RepID=A0A6A6SGK4_9PLEO|nr:hypothetical protein P280DRAFT_3059 [Massarina eburnea CBS 473.64]
MRWTSSECCAMCISDRRLRFNRSGDCRPWSTGGRMPSWPAQPGAGESVQKAATLKGAREARSRAPRGRSPYACQSSRPEQLVPTCCRPSTRRRETLEWTPAEHHGMNHGQQKSVQNRPKPSKAVAFFYVRTHHNNNSCRSHFSRYCQNCHPVSTMCVCACVRTVAVLLWRWKNTGIHGSPPISHFVFLSGLLPREGLSVISRRG